MQVSKDGLNARLGRHWLPIEAGLTRNIAARLRRLWKQLTCKHTHTFTFYLEGSWWESCGVRKAGHTGLNLRGCYLCGQVWVEDFKA